jgi:hypothetical protein
MGSFPQIEHPELPVNALCACMLGPAARLLLGASKLSPASFGSPTAAPSLLSLLQHGKLVRIILRKIPFPAKICNEGNARRHELNIGTGVCAMVQQ